MDKHMTLQLIENEIDRLKEDSAYREIQGVTFTADSLVVLRKLLARAVSSGKRSDFDSFYKFLSDGTSPRSDLSKLTEKIVKTELEK